jgi:hypothetical protein
MPTTELGAYQEMVERLRAAAALIPAAANMDYVPDIRYPDKQYPPAKKDKLFLTFTLAQVGEKRRTLGRPPRITYTGIASVQVFVPITDTNAAERGRLVAEVLLNGFQRSTASVNFTKAGIKDMPVQDAWYYKRVFATYDFDQIGPLQP